MPETLPSIDSDTLSAWQKLSYSDLAEVLFSLFVGSEIEPHVLRPLLRSCYADFASSEVVPVPKIGTFHVAELFHGPTFCFKDLGQQPLVRLLAHFANRRGHRRTMLVSTTGDTGPAALRAVSDAASPYLEMYVFFPRGQISELQRKQMTTVCSAQVRVTSFEGGGDDMDGPIKSLASDEALAARIGLCGINSYNVGRVVAQLVHYFWIYLRVVDQCGSPVGTPIDIVIPTGAMGNIAAGFMAKRMGLPLRRLVAGVNTNDITHRTFAKGEFHRSDEMDTALSAAINIQVPYNMERIFYYLTDEDAAQTSAWMVEMERSGRVTLSREWLLQLQKTFGSRRIDDPTMCEALRRARHSHGYLADPHTGVALAAAWEEYGSGATAVPVAVLATASPCKFQEALTATFGRDMWEEYLSGNTFPKEARNVLAAPEVQLSSFKSRGPLAASQRAWECELRELLEAKPREMARL